MNRVCVTVAVVLVLGIGGSLAASKQTSAPRSPDVVKGQGKVGDRKDAPDGWVCYVLGGRGVLWTPIRTYEPKTIPGTEKDRVTCLDMSDEGNWVAYINKSGKSDISLVMVQRDGTGYTALKPERLAESSCLYAGFWHGSPLAGGKPDKAAIWYAVSDKEVLAAEVDFSSGKPVLGAPRAIAKAEDPKFSFVSKFGLRVSANHMYNGYTQFVIPDGGLGVAAENSARGGSGGCGMSLSHDGKLSASNPPATSHRSFVPMGHSYLLVMDFGDDSAPPDTARVGRLERFFEKNVVSLNTAPRVVEEWHDYSFANNPQYLALRMNSKNSSFPLGDENEPLQGIWLVHWPSNVWYQVAHEPATGGMRQPVAHIEPASSQEQTPRDASSKAQEEGHEPK